jgi:hypothetical protein
VSFNRITAPTIDEIEEKIRHLQNKEYKKNPRTSVVDIAPFVDVYPRLRPGQHWQVPRVKGDFDIIS